MSGTKILVVGMNPSNKPILLDRPNPSIKRLNEWMLFVGIKHYSFCNTFEDPSEPHISKVDFNRLLAVSAGYERIISLGSFVGNALDKSGIKHYRLPHPSPRNRLFNNPQFEPRVLENLNKYINHN